MTAEIRKKRAGDTGGPRPIQMPGKRVVARCAHCGAFIQGLAEEPTVAATATCTQCGSALHSCKQCTYFDPASRFECRQPITERIARKADANSCSFYALRVTVERETSAGARPQDARQTFENLFKKK